MMKGQTQTAGRQAACFTGHRPSKFSFKYNERHPDCVRIKGLLAQAIEDAISGGWNYFIAGGALGVDTWAAEAVLELKKKYPQIMLEIAVPCQGQERMWPQASQDRYHAILKQADVVHMCSDQTYAAKLMLERDYYMVDHSTLLIAVFDGSTGGTKHTYDYAQHKVGLKIARINPLDFTVTGPITTKPSKSAKPLPGPMDGQGKTLECSSKGDRDYSSLCARVTAFDVTDLIENHYQLAKRFRDDEGRVIAPNSWRDAKGKAPCHLVINGIKVDAKHLTAWFNYLWWKYLEDNPDLAAYARTFDDYHDMFRGKKSINCQADAIRTYCKQGPDALLDTEFLTIMGIKP